MTAPAGAAIRPFAGWARIVAQMPVSGTIDRPCRPRGDDQTDTAQRSPASSGARAAIPGIAGPVDDHAASNRYANIGLFLADWARDNSQRLYEAAEVDLARPDEYGTRTISISGE